MISRSDQPTILELVPNLARKSDQEFAGPCPWCGGDDRFIVWPFQGSGGRFLCRRCDSKGDAIDLLRDQGFSFAEAKNRIEGEVNLRVEQLIRKKPRKTKVDHEKWRNAAKDFLRKSSANRCQEWLELLKQRHLSEETAIRFGIEWNPTDLYLPSIDWGVESEKKLRIPAGLLVPAMQKEAVIGIIVRCRDRINNPKYWQVKGSGLENLVFGKVGLPVVIVESHLDAYLIWQEASDLVAVISLSGTSKEFDPVSLNYLKNADQVFISTDFDSTEDHDLGAGQTAYLELLSKLPEATYLPTPVGKDPCEMVSLGVSIRKWLEIGIKPPPQKLQLVTDYPGSVERLLQDLKQYPDLIPCPITRKPWYWMFRKDCGSCSGHIHCLKDVPIDGHINQNS